MDRAEIDAARALAEKYNAKRASEGKTGMKWIADLHGGLHLVPADRGAPAHQPELSDDGKLL